MKDRVPEPGKEGRVKITLDDGQVIEGIMGMADNPSEPGTPFAKSTMLTDETAELLGLDSSAVPDDAFRCLAKLAMASIVVTAPTGSEVTVSNGQETLTAEEKNGKWYFSYITVGTWAATRVTNGVTMTQTVDVQEAKQYDVDLWARPVLNDNDWDIISEVSVAGIGGNYWDVGDAKEITLNGTIGITSYSNVTLSVFILHFNLSINGTAQNNIVWGGFKSALTGGVDVALADSNYGNNPTSGTKSFNMNHWWNTSTYGSNYGGWKGTDLRYDILGATEKKASGYGAIKSTSNTGYDATQAAITSPVANTLMAALPSDFRSILRLWTRWVDNKGNSSNVDANVTACVDAGISLLTEFEVQGARTYANQYEQNHQVQMLYYANGNSKKRYRSDNTSSAVWWWCASPRYDYSISFCAVSADGGADFYNASYSGGCGPAFLT